VRAWCNQYGVLFKLNTVVNNWQEDMAHEVALLRPVRWKVFQCLAIGAENLGPGALRQVEPFLVTEEQWAAFLHRHRALPCLMPESNEAMRNSYLILDEYMRFLDNTGGS
jgi:radical S-adenosyl methionine domain-containing protein 2